MSTTIHDDLLELTLAIKGERRGLTRLADIGCCCCCSSSCGSRPQRPK